MLFASALKKSKLLFLRIYNGKQLAYSIPEVFRLIFFRSVRTSSSRRKLFHNKLKKIHPTQIKVLVISLPYRIDRRDVIIKRFGNLSIPFSFIDGVALSNKTQVDVLARKISSPSRQFLSEGSLGCILAHERAIKYALQSSCNIFAIFEDDVLLPDIFKDSLESLIKNIPENFDIVYLGSRNKTTKNIAFWVSKHLYVPIYPRKGQYAYLLSRKGAEKIVSFLYPVKIVLGGIDTIIGRLVSKKILTAYHVHPVLCGVDLEITSDIENPSIPTKSLFCK